jgi:hypothetical protein
MHSLIDRKRIRRRVTFRSTGMGDRADSRPVGSVAYRCGVRESRSPRGPIVAWGSR